MNVVVVIIKLYIYLYPLPSQIMNMATTEGGNTARQAQQTLADTMNRASHAEGAGRPDKHIT